MESKRQAFIIGRRFGKSMSVEKAIAELYPNAAKAKKLKESKLYKAMK